MDLRFLAAVPLDVARALSAIGTRIDTALRRLDELATGMNAMHEEMKGFRSDLNRVGAGIDALRGDVQSMESGVTGIRAATESLDAKVDERLTDLTATLAGVDALATRLGRIGVRRTKAGPDPATDTAA
jgi:uncharacterized protein YoxC